MGEKPPTCLPACSRQFIKRTGVRSCSSSFNWILLSQTSQDWTYPYLLGVRLSSCSGLSVACVPVPHVTLARSFSRKAERFTGTPVCAENARTLRRSGTPARDGCSPWRCASTSAGSLAPHRTTWARCVIGTTASGSPRMEALKLVALRERLFLKNASQTPTHPIVESERFLF